MPWQIIGRSNTPKQPSTIDKELEASEKELTEESQRLQGKDAQIANIRRSVRDQLGDVAEGSADRRSVSMKSADDLRDEIIARQAEHAVELDEQRVRILEQQELELQDVAEESSKVRSSGEKNRGKPRARNELHHFAEETCRAQIRDSQVIADLEASRHRDDAESSEREIRKLNEQLGQLSREHAAAAQAIYESRALRKDECYDPSLPSRHEPSLPSRPDSVAPPATQRLSAVQEEHLRAEQRYTDLEGHLRVQMRDLRSEMRSKFDEVSKRNAILGRRDQELAELNGQLIELQSLFDDVNRQLTVECARIEKLQAAVASSVKQGKELRQLQGMLEDSHKMIVQVREALQQEQGERVKASGLLQHEQQRTQLLLDVLKHFKEKLQGFMPQQFFSQLGSLDQKNSAAASGDIAVNANTFVGGGAIYIHPGLSQGLDGLECIRHSAVPADYIGTPRCAAVADGISANACTPYSNSGVGAQGRLADRTHKLQ